MRHKFNYEYARVYKKKGFSIHLRDLKLIFIRFYECKKLWMYSTIRKQRRRMQNFPKTSTKRIKNEFFFCGPTLL